MSIDSNVATGSFSESTYRQILDAISDMVFVKGPHSNLLWANRAFCDFYGMSAEQLRGLIDAPVNDDATQSFLEDDRKVFRTKETLEIPEEKVVRHDGVARNFNTVKSPIFDANGDVSLLVGLARDITERLASEELIRRNENFLTAVLDNTPAVVYVKDRVGKYVLVNSRYCEIFDLKKEQIVGKTDEDIFSKEYADGFRRADLEVMTTGRPVQSEERAPQTDGIHIYLSTKFPLVDSAGRVYAVCGISTDITERVNAENLLQAERAHSAFNAKLASLGEMAGGIAHEINTPLATLKTLSSQLVICTAEKEIDRQMVTEISEIIEVTTDRIAKIVKNLRAFSRDGSADPMVEVPVRSMVNDTLSFCRSKFIDHQIDLEIPDIPEDLVFYGREVEISQVLVNLLNNAFDAVAESKTKRVQLKVETKGNRILLSVEDSGPGVPPEQRDKIFQPFHTTKEVGKGTGLGLSISKRIVESHGGTLTLDQNSKHTHFVVALPLKCGLPV